MLLRGFGERRNENIKCQLSDWSEAQGAFLIFRFQFGKNTQQHVPVPAVIVSAEEVGAARAAFSFVFLAYYFLECIDATANSLSVPPKYETVGTWRKMDAAPFIPELDLFQRMTCLFRDFSFPS